MAGIDDVQLDEHSRLPRAQLERVQAAMASTIGDVDHIARTVEFVLVQPIELNLEEIAVRPQKSLFSPGANRTCQT